MPDELKEALKAIMRASEGPDILAAIVSTLRIISGSMTSENDITEYLRGNSIIMSELANGMKSAIDYLIDQLDISETIKNSDEYKAFEQAAVDNNVVWAADNQLFNSYGIQPPTKKSSEATLAAIDNLHASETFTERYHMTSISGAYSSDDRQMSKTVQTPENYLKIYIGDKTNIKLTIHTVRSAPAIVIASKNILLNNNNITIKDFMERYFDVIKSYAELRDTLTPEVVYMSDGASYPGSFPSMDITLEIDESVLGKDNVQYLYLAQSDPPNPSIVTSGPKADSFGIMDVTIEYTYDNQCIRGDVINGSREDSEIFVEG